ncbi:MAG: ATP-binding protein [Gemmatimonadales bacterium]|jgi:PAS domain S-box-containing protein
MAPPQPSRVGLAPLGASVPSHPGLRLLADVSAALTEGVFSEAAMASVVTILRQGFGALLCRLWVREEDGVSFRAIAAAGDEPSTDEAGRIADALRTGALAPADTWDALDLSVPLVHQDERLGLLQVRVPRDGREAMERDVLTVVASVLAPLLASKELSQDLAFEIARRAREIDDQRRFTAKVIDSLPVGLYVIDRDYRIQAWNRKRETGTQGVPREEAIGRPIFEVLSRQPRDLLRREFDEVLASGKMQVIEQESTATGDARHYRITKIPMRINDDDVTHIITIGEDITEWKNVQRQIAQSEKLAAIGQLAAGVMHEINNPLATIGACCEAVSAVAGDAPEAVQAGIAEYVKIMDAEVQRCKHIVEGLLDMSRPRSGARAPTDVNKVVEDTLFLLKHHERFKHVTIKRELSEGLPAIRADGEQLIQVFMALMLNAMDAMDARGTLTVSTSKSAARGDEVVIALSDTGKGIPRQDIQKIFEPFYTTKPQGRGTGLGLSICYSIVSDHHGRIEVDSELGRGSTFRVILPTGEDPRH